MAETCREEKLTRSLEFAAKKLKIPHFKDIQVEAITSALNGKDVFVNLPTGYGKNAMYQAIPQQHITRTRVNMHKR